MEFDRRFGTSVTKSLVNVQSHWSLFSKLGGTVSLRVSRCRGFDNMTQLYHFIQSLLGPIVNFRWHIYNKNLKRKDLQFVFISSTMAASRRPSTSNPVRKRSSLNSSKVNVKFVLNELYGNQGENGDQEGDCRKSFSIPSQQRRLVLDMFPKYINNRRLILIFLKGQLTFFIHFKSVLNTDSSQVDKDIIRLLSVRLRYLHG